MADYIVKDTELTSVANAIRTAGGTNSLLSFPNGFVSAVNNISGGGSSDFSTAEVTITLQSADPDPYYWPTPTIISDELICGNYAQLTATETHTVVLHKGSCEVYMENVSSTSGNIVVENDVATITGDCTITLEDSK